MEYGQFCPIAKASEILGEKWTILIVRELLMGSSRFSELQRGLGHISPTILTKRLLLLEERGLILRRRIRGQRGFEYHPTKSCKELLPILLGLGVWGLRWAQTHLVESDYDVQLLMLYLERSIVTENLPGDETVIKFQFSDLAEMSDWWIVVTGDEVDVCTSDPGRDVDIYFTTTVQVMTDVWMERMSYRAATKAGSLTMTGPRVLTKNITSWMRSCVFADLPSAQEILAGSPNL